MSNKAVAILVGGGPAPGINGVISAATIEAINRGHKVYGIHRGYELVGKGDLSCITELSIQNVSRIHNEGGSILGTSRFNPTKSPEALDNIISALKQKDVGFLVTIGGDDTATSAQAVAVRAAGAISVGHVPKTIDNDLPLPSKDSTFGYESARTTGTSIVETLMIDAKTTRRWYFVVAMGRKAGHLALGIGISSGATITIIPEELGDGHIPMTTLVDIIVGSMLRRLEKGRPYGVAVLAEGLVEKLDPESIPELAHAERDPHGHIRLAEVEFGVILKNAVRRRMKELGISGIPIVEKNVGYELRCCPPIPFDKEYTRQLGYGVIDYLCSGGSGAMVTRRGDELVPLPFSEMMDSGTGHSKIRLVDTNSSLYRIARKYMIRLGLKHLEDSEELQRLASNTNLSPEELRRQFDTVARDYGW